MSAIFLFLLGSLLFIKPVFAGEPPAQITPANSSSVSSSTLNWQAPSYTLYSSDSYRIQVDDDPSFPGSTINKNYYTKNTYYSPVLNEGLWYWRVRARDASSTWSDWSSIWSFTLQSTSTPPSPTPSTPTPSPIPASSFTISNTPSQINSDQSFGVSVHLSLPNNPNTPFYLKGAFKKADSSNYFGLTKVSGSWIKNGSSYSEQYQITTDGAGNWSGNLEVQPDSEDSGFTGSGDYIFKVARYTSTGSGPTWSNESTIQIIAIENVDQDGASSDNSSSATTPSSSPQPEQSAKTKSSSQSKRSNTLVYRSATVAAATVSASPLAIAVKTQKNTSNIITWIGTVLILSGTSLLAYIYLRSRGLHEAISNFFRKRN